MGAAAAGMAGGMVASQIVGGMMASSAQKKAMAQEAALREAALGIANALKIPTAEAEKLVLQSPELVWEFIPEEEKAILLEGTKMSEIEVDPRLKQAEMEALEGLRERSTGGLTDADIAGFSQLRRKTAAEAEARDSRILQNMAERGILGSGAELASRQSSSQQAMLAQSEEADRLAQSIAQAKMQALGQLGTYSSGLREQEFGEQSQVASAEDIIAKFNALQQSETQQRNIAARNIAEQSKQTLKQQLETDRINAANQIAQWDAEAAGRKFERESQKAGLQIGTLGGMASAAGTAGQQKAQSYQQLGSGVSSVIGSVYGAYASSPEKSTKTTPTNTQATTYSPGYKQAIG